MKSFKALGGCVREEHWSCCAFTVKGLKVCAFFLLLSDVRDTITTGKMIVMCIYSTLSEVGGLLLSVIVGRSETERAQGHM